MQQKLVLGLSVALLWVLSPTQAQEAAVLPDTTGRTSAPSAAAPVGPGAGAITTFAAEEFNRGPILYSPLQLIQGRVPGLAIMRTRGGDPLQDMPVQLRGTSTLYGNTNLLYVIDGVPQASFNAVMPEDIQSIEVLRDASATALYGMRGANGVLKVTTRKGSPGRPAVSYGAYGYFETVSRKASFFTAGEWREAKRDWARSTDSGLQNITSHMIDAGGDTDWLREIGQRKASQLHHLSVAGGSTNTHYYAAASYRALHGAVRGSGNRLVNGRVSLSQRALKDKLTFEGTFGITPSQYNQYAPPVGAFNTSIIDLAEGFNPTVPLDSAYWQNRPNPVTQLNNTSNRHDRDDWLARAGAKYQLVKGLTLSALVARERLHRNSFLFTRTRHTDGTQEDTRQEALAESSTTLETTLDYRLAAAGHHLDLRAGYATQNFGTALHVEQRASLIGRPTGLGRPTSGVKQSISFDYAIASLFGSASYGYKNRYLLSASLRRDQSPTYVANAEPVYFPAFNLGWRLSNEFFLQKWSWLSQLMLRAGYGVSGRTRPLTAGFSDNAFVTPNLRGEKLAETNLGADLGILADRLVVRVDYYRRTTRDLILSHAVPAGGGFTTIIMNEGKLYNRGWEVAVESQPVRTASFRWSISLVASFNRNEAQVYREGAPDGLRWGQPVGTLYGYRFGGFAPDGRVLYLDKNGRAVDWTAIGQSDRVPLGNGAPTTHFGLDNRLSWGRLDLTLLLRGAAGFHIHNRHRALNLQEYLARYNVLREAATLPYNVLHRSDALRTSTDFFVEKGDFVKVDNLTLGYALPLKSRLLQGVRVVAAGHNLATLTRFKGLDPEMAGITAITPGIYDRNAYFATRVWALGIHASL